MTPSVKPCGRQIHMAAHALGSVRNTALEAAGIEFPYWVVLETVIETPGADRDMLIGRLVALTVHNEASADRAINELRDRGLIAESAAKPGVVELTSEGQALAGKVIATRTHLRDELYGGITPHDMTTTTRVLEQITTQARSVHASQTAAVERRLSN